MAMTHPAETNNAVVTSWLPLTTGWSSVGMCGFIFKIDLEPSKNLDGFRHELDLGLDDDPFASDEVLVAFDPDFPLSIDPYDQCQPDEVRAWWNQTALEKASRTQTSLLPLICPDAWSTVETFVKSSISTQIMCCPPKYGLYNFGGLSTGVKGHCVSRVRSGDGLLYLSAMVRGNSYIYNSTLTSTSLNSDSTVRAIPIVGWNVQSTASSTLNPITGQIRSKTEVSFPTQTRSTNDNDKNGGLSNDAIRGICATTAVITLIIVALVAWMFILKRRHSTGLKANEPEVQSHRIDPDGDSDSHRPRELDDSPRINELGHTNRFELDPVSTAVELGAASPKTFTVRLPDLE